MFIMFITFITFVTFGFVALLSYRGSDAALTRLSLSALFFQSIYNVSTSAVEVTLNLVVPLFWLIRTSLVRTDKQFFRLSAVTNVRFRRSALLVNSNLAGSCR